ncbi:MAG: methyltransferase domain-containing protein [Bacteroidota bacterium]
MLPHDLFHQHADRYAEQYADQARYFPSFDRFLAQLPGDPPRVLELACGPGNATAYLLQHRPEIELLGWDLAPRMIEIAREAHPGARFEVKAMQDTPELSGNWNGIFCAFGLPYLDREAVQRLCHESSRLLEPGGVLYLSCMEDDYSASRWQGPSSGEGSQIFMHYYREATLRSYVQAAGLRVLSVDRLPGLTEDAPPDVMLVACKTG